MNKAVLAIALGILVALVYALGVKAAEPYSVPQIKQTSPFGHPARCHVYAEIAWALTVQRQAIPTMEKSVRLSAALADVKREWALDSSNLPFPHDLEQIIVATYDFVYAPEVASFTPDQVQLAYLRVCQAMLIPQANQI